MIFLRRLLVPPLLVIHVDGIALVLGSLPRRLVLESEGLWGGATAGARRTDILPGRLLPSVSLLVGDVDLPAIGNHLRLSEYLSVWAGPILTFLVCSGTPGIDPCGGRGLLRLCELLF